MKRDNIKVLYIPHVPWDIRQRAKYLIEHLQKSYEVHVITWTSVHSIQDYLRPEVLLNTVRRTTYQLPGQNIILHQVPKLSPSLYSARIRSLNLTILERAIKKIIEDHNISVVVAAAPIRLPSLKIPVIADYFDNNPSFWRHVRKMDKIAQEIDVLEQELAQAARVRTVVSHVLGDKINGWGYDFVYLPNGYNSRQIQGGNREHFRRALGIPQDGILVGYISRFTESSGLLRAVESVPLWPKGVHFALIGSGPQLKPAQELAQHLNVPQVHFLGQPEDARDFFAGIDVGLLPRDTVPMEDAACHIKLLEYSAAGKRTISTKMAEVPRMGIPGVILVDATPEGISQGIREFQAAAEKAVDPQCVEGYQWSTLAQQMSALIREVI